MRLIWPLLLVPSLILANVSFDPPTKDDLRKLLEHSTAYEMANRIADDLCKEYDDLCPANKDEKILLKREMIYFAASEEDARDKVLEGSPSSYKILPGVITKLKEINRRDVPEVKEDGHKFLIYQLCMKPVMDLLKEKKRKYEGMNKKEIRSDVVANLKRLMELF
ncbi:hypothetical protein PMAYCL1PPCAC_06070, partial [Pristionchus mayeri]